MVPDTRTWRRLFGANGVAEGLSAGKIVIDELDLPFDTKAAERINKLGCEYVDAPVSGGELGPRMPRCHGGSNRQHVRKVKPLFELMGKNITLVGGNGAGQTCKVANQIIVALNIEAVAEAVVRVKGQRRSSQGASGADGWLRFVARAGVHGERMIKRTFDPGFRIELHQKDLNLALATARKIESACPTPRLHKSCSMLARRKAAASGILGDGESAQALAAQVAK